MGIIKQEVKDLHLSAFPDEEAILKPFLAGFDINWARRRKAYNTELSVYFLGPERPISELYGFDREVMLVVSDFDSVEPRTMQAAEALISEEPARGRVEQTVFFLAARPTDSRQWVASYTSQNPQARIPVVFTVQELRDAAGDAWYVRNTLAHQLFSRDLFDYQLPLDNDLFFFGRDAIIAEHLDAIRRSQNRGIFGLRKTGKTSILYKLRRIIEREGYGAFLYYDCKLPSLRMLHWDEFLSRIIGDLSAYYGIKTTGHFTERSVADGLIAVLQKTPTSKNTALVFDEIEYISPLSVTDPHWHKEFVPFWQTLWSAQSQVRRLSNTIAGVNPTVVEMDSVAGVQNPMFGIIQTRYLRGFDLAEMTNMVRVFGKRMGLRFNVNAMAYLHGRYGGHPLLTRMACSNVNAEVTAQAAQRPYEVDSAFLARTEAVRDGALTFYCRHVVSELRQFYGDEYAMLELLASGRVVDFMDLGVEPEWINHLKSYGLVQIDGVGKPSFAIPVVGRYVGMELARKEGRVLQRDVIAQPDRSRWVRQRTNAITREVRELERLMTRVGQPHLYVSGSFPEAERFGNATPCSTHDEFVAFINICNRCLVESVEKYGVSVGVKDYFWTTAKKMYPDFWDALNRVKVYRHNDLHLELNAPTLAELDRYFKADLEGRRPSQVKEVWFLLQQCVLDGLLVGVQCEINRLT